jgi:hypothetical protein
MKKCQHSRKVEKNNIRSHRNTLLGGIRYAVNRADRYIIRHYTDYSTDFEGIWILSIALKRTYVSYKLNLYCLQ